MRAAYDDLPAIGLPMHIIRQGGDDDPDAIVEPESAEFRAARSNSALEPTKVASLVEQFREENPLLDRLTDAKGVDIEADTRPAILYQGDAKAHRSFDQGWPALLTPCVARYC